MAIAALCILVALGVLVAIARDIAKEARSRWTP